MAAPYSRKVLHLVFENAQLSQYSTGIYLIHVLGIFLIQKFFDIGPTLLTVLAVLLAALASYLLIRISKRLPFIL